MQVAIDLPLYENITFDLYQIHPLAVLQPLQDSPFSIIPQAPFIASTYLDHVFLTKDELQKCTTPITNIVYCTQPHLYNFRKLVNIHS